MKFLKNLRKFANKIWFKAFKNHKPRVFQGDISFLWVQEHSILRVSGEHDHCFDSSDIHAQLQSYFLNSFNGTYSPLAARFTYHRVTSCLLSSVKNCFLVLNYSKNISQRTYQCYDWFRGRIVLFVIYVLPTEIAWATIEWKSASIMYVCERTMKGIDEEDLKPLKWYKCFLSCQDEKLPWIIYVCKRSTRKIDEEDLRYTSQPIKWHKWLWKLAESCKLNFRSQKFD